MTTESFVTLATNENYAIGALTLGQSLRNVGTTRKLTVMITNDISNPLQNQLRSVFDLVEYVNVLNSNDAANLALLKRPELGITFTKLHCWRLEQFTKCVFLDADCLVLKNIDELFDREELSAATDVGWPDCFNSGVFVYKPSVQTYSKLLEFAVNTGSFDGGDQGLLNSFFKDWSVSESSRRLPFIYNMTSNVAYGYAPALKQFGESVKVVHFIGAQKPWYYRYNTDTQTICGTGPNESQFLNNWWSVFVKNVFNSLNDETRGRISSQLVSAPKENPQPAPASSWNQGGYPMGGYPSMNPENTYYPTGSVSTGGVIVGSDQHQNLWEKGQIEYKGRDSFSNIQAHLDSQLKK